MYIQYLRKEDGMFALIGEPVALNAEELKQLKEKGKMPNAPSNATHYQLHERLEVLAPANDMLLVSGWTRVSNIERLS